MGMHMINKKLLLIFCIIISIAGFTQVSDEYGYHKYKKRFPKESFIYLSLDYVDVFDINKDELEITLGYREKLLYLNNNAFQLSQRTVGYDQFTSIENLDATCYYPENGKYKKEKVKDFIEEQSISEGISFYDDSKQRKFRYNKLREGAVTDLQYDILANEPRLLNRRVFSRRLYKKEQSYTIRVHEDIDLGFKTFNMDKADIQYSESIDGDFKVYKWQVSDMEKLSTYGDDDNELYIMPQVIPYIKSYSIDGEKINIFRNLDDLYVWYSSLIAQVKPSENGQLKKLADSITGGAVSELEKVQKVYYWVQDKVKYIAFGDGYGGFVPRDPDQIYKRRFGDCKDMSCLTINLLKELDIPVYFTWVGTREIPYGYSELFTPQVDNHMIATYYDNQDKAYYLDATNPNLLFGRPSSFIQGKEVLVGLNEKEYRKDTVPIIEANINQEIDTLRMRLEGKKVVGQGSFLFTGYLAEEVYAEFKRTPKEDIIKRFNNKLSKGSNKFSGSKVEYYRPNESKDSLRIDYDFEIDSYISSIDNSLYVNLNLTKQFKEFKINEKLNIPIIFDFKYFLKKKFYFDIPVGYNTASIPENISFESDLFNYSIEYLKKGSQLIYELKFTQNIIQLQPEQVTEWNKYIANLSDVLDESVKLTKN